MHGFNWAVTLLATIVAALMLTISFGATGAPQQAAGAAVAVALVAIPYVWSRACDELGATPDRQPSPLTGEEQQAQDEARAQLRQRTAKSAAIIVVGLGAAIGLLMWLAEQGYIR